MSWRRLRPVGAALVAAGLLVTIAVVGYDAYGVWGQARLNQQWAQQRKAALAATPVSGTPDSSTQTTAPDSSTPTTLPTPAVAATATPTPTPAKVLYPIFAIQIPSLGYFAAVQEGVSLGILADGPGHYPTTALPGQAGNVGIAAHNVFWSNLGNLKVGDKIVLQSLTANYTYTVTSTQIVNPADNSSLASSSQHLLTLTTCWPLWAGVLANQRFIISAAQA